MPDHTYGGYHFDDGDLSRIIDNTNSTIGDLQRLNAQVQSHEQSLISANQSNSGQLMRQRLAIWNDDFGLAIRDLTELNGRVERLLQGNRNAAHHAESAAGSSS